jgi:hypothetical protein
MGACGGVHSRPVLPSCGDLATLALEAAHCVARLQCIASEVGALGAVVDELHLLSPGGSHVCTEGACLHYCRQSRSGPTGIQIVGSLFAGNGDD